MGVVTTMTFPLSCNGSYLEALLSVRSRCGAPFFEVAAMAHPNNPIRYAYGPKWCVYHADTLNDRRTDGRRTRSVTQPQMANIVESDAKGNWILWLRTLL
uniref:Uncharacterized protein n=1 Tax=Angiostrongylus cantonensis TaxID=6313 RepID=A0A0K0DDI2_ANGCA